MGHDDERIIEARRLKNIADLEEARSRQLRISVSELREAQGLVQRKIEGRRRRAGTTRGVEKAFTFLSNLPENLRKLPLRASRRPTPTPKPTLKVTPRKVFLGPVRPTTRVKLFRETGITRRKITFGQPQKFGESFRRATGQTSFTIAVPQRRENGKIRVQDFNFLFDEKTGKIIRTRATGSALITEKQFLKVDKSRRDKTPGFTFGDTRTVIPVPTPKKKITEKISRFVEGGIGLNFFENKRNQEEKNIQNSLNTFAEKRQNFYQGRVNSGLISVDQANKKLNEDIDKEFNKSVQTNEFFRSKNPRQPTTNLLSFNYETKRLEALERGEKKRADQFLFFKIVADAPTSLIKLGKEGKEGINKLINDPLARETSIKKIKEIFKIEKAFSTTLTLPQKSTDAIIKGAKFAITSPTTALAIVAGNIIGFKIVTKAGKPILRAIGILSKKTSKQILKNLKFKPFVKAGVFGIGKVTIELSPKIIKVVSKATRTGRSLAISKKATEKLIKSVNTSIKKSKIGVKVSKVSRKLSKEQLRLRKRRLRKRIQSLRFASRITRRIRKLRRGGRVIGPETIKEISKRLKKLRKREKLLEKKKRLKIKKEIKAEAKILRKLRRGGRVIGPETIKEISKRLKKLRKREKLLEKKKKVKKKISKLPLVKKIKKISKERRLKKVRKIERKRIVKRRKQKIIRRKTLLKREKFRRSKIGKLKIKVSKKIKDLDTALKKFESPSAKLLLDKTKKTPLSRTFPIELKFEINDKVVEDFVRKQLKSEGQDFDKLSGIDRNFLTGQVKAFIINNPKDFIPRARKKLLKRFQKTKVKKGVKRTLTIKVEGGGKIVSTKIRPTPIKKVPSRPTRPSRPGRQLLLQVQKPQIKPKPLKILDVEIVPLKLTFGQKRLLKRFKKSQGKQKVLQKQVTVLRQRQLVKVRKRQKISQRQKQKLKIKSNALQKLSIVSLILSKQILKERQRQLTRQKIKLKLLEKIKQTPKLKLEQKTLQAQIQAQIQGLKEGIQITKPTRPLRPFVAIAFIGRGKRIRKRKPTRQKSFDVFARPLKKRKGQKRPKLIKVNKVPLTEQRAKDLRNFIADTSLSRTARIKPTGGKPRRSRLKVPRGFAKKTSKKFRRFRIVKGRRKRLTRGKVIEKGRHLLDTRQEKRQITLRRRIKQITPKKRKNIKRTRSLKRRKR